MEKVLSLFQDLDPIPLKSFEGKCVAILGVRESGKSNSAARMVEQFLRNRVPMTIVDTLGEYWGLKEGFNNIFVVGKSPHVDIEIESNRQAAAVAMWSIEERVPVILDLKDHDDDKRFELLKAYFEALWRTAGILFRGYQIFLEEAHTWIPQSEKTPVKAIFTRIAAEGRSRGLNIIMISQRPARLDKNVLTQANMLLLHRALGRDLDAYQELVPTTRKDRSFVEDTVPNLETGQAVFVHTRGYNVVQMLRRETHHAGQTPSLDVDAAEEQPILTSVPSDLLESLRRTISKVRDDEGETDDPTEALITQIAELEQELAERDREIADQDLEIADLKTHVEHLSKLVVRMPENLQINAVVPYAQPSPYGSPAVAVVAPTTADAATTIKRGVRLQEQRFETLLRDVKKLQWQMHRVVLGYLLRRDDQTLTLPVLAQRTGYAQNTVIRNPPTPLIELKLLQRTKIGVRTWEYTANGTRAFLQEEYPDLDTETLIEKLLAACPAE